MRLRSRVDTNQAVIVKALRSVGCSVLHLHQLGRGVPDILASYHDCLYLMEIKDGSRAASERRLTQDEFEWHSAWDGPVYIVETIADALSVIGVEIK